MSTENPKHLFESKTFWANAVAIFGLIGARYGLDVPVEEQGELVAGILAVVNIVLRIITKTPVQV